MTPLLFESNSLLAQGRDDLGAILAGGRVLCVTSPSEPVEQCHGKVLAADPHLSADGLGGLSPLVMAGFAVGWQQTQRRPASGFVSIDEIVISSRQNPSERFFPRGMRATYGQGSLDDRGSAAQAESSGPGPVRR